MDDTKGGEYQKEKDTRIGWIPEGGVYKKVKVIKRRKKPVCGGYQTKEEEVEKNQ